MSDGLGEWEAMGSPDSSATSSPTSSIQSPPPHTPLFSPSSTSSHSPASELEPPELSDEIVRAGWRRCFSGREKKHYYFNKLTQQSLWEMPTLSSARKRTSSHHEPAQPFKKFIPSDWDLVLETNVHMCERVPLNIYPTLPEMETRRIDAVARLRTLAHELNRTKEGNDVPNDFLQRWLMERKVEDCGREPLLPQQCPTAVSPVLFRDLLGCVPIKNQKIRSIPEARKHAGKYADAAKRMAEKSREMSNDERKQVKWQCEAMFDFLRQSAGNTKFEEFLNRMKFLKAQCQGILTEAAKPGIETFCTKLHNSATELAQALQEKQREMLEQCGLELNEDPLPAPKADKADEGYVKLSCRDPNNGMPPQPSIKLNAAHFFKLEQLYRINTFDDRRFDLFLTRTWCLLRRYQCLYGVGDGEGASLQRSLPVPVFEVLKRDFGATLEAFASPLNAYFRQFCSLFPDTDGFFGSRGNFLHFFPVDGSIVVHPPFVEEVMEAAATKVVERLRCAPSDRPLSFFVVLPEWEDPPLVADSILQGEVGMLRKRLRVASYDVCWRHGAQQWMPGNAADLLQRSAQGVFLYWLQNDAAAQKWPLTPEKVNAVVSALATPSHVARQQSPVEISSPRHSL